MTARAGTAGGRGARFPPRAKPSDGHRYTSVAVVAKKAGEACHDVVS